MEPDIYRTVTDAIIADLERGVRPWQRPWHAPSGQTSLPLRANGEPYRGINVLALWLQALNRGFVSPYWLTFKQADELGAHVRKGERASRIVYAATMTRPSDDTADTDDIRAVAFLKTYAVFSADQIDGLPERFTIEPTRPTRPVERLAEAEGFIAATGADVRHGGARALYVPSQDFVQMPPIDSFIDSQGYYATLCHELTHWTGHTSRLARVFSTTRWGDVTYAAEELVAELGAAFTCARLGLTPEIREDHAAYIASWLKVLKNDKRAILSAAAQAQRAVDYLFAFQAASVEAA